MDISVPPILFHQSGNIFISMLSFGGNKNIVVRHSGFGMWMEISMRASVSQRDNLCVLTDTASCLVHSHCLTRTHE